jgi:hypothetical protein|tara:strand:- start:840 stop:974 length:135 start_codon:yes stop_codon:yes gene_type:complete
MLANIIQVSGAVLLSLGVGLIFPPAGVIVAGILAIVFGISLERA